jgi:glycerol-3-phosphate cytidylyltransferase
MTIIITFGTYDLFHIGHLNLLRRASELGDKLICGVSSDKFSVEKKNRKPIFNDMHRLEIVSSIKYVDDVFLEESMEAKRDYILKYKADILVMGNDWEGRLDEFKDICAVVYFPRTEEVTTTNLICKIQDLI